MFELNKQQAKLESLNVRAEKHGEDNVPAADLKLRVNLANAALDHFDKRLRKTLYRKPSGAGEQTDLPLEQTDGLTALTFKHLAPLRWDEDFPGYSLSIDSGLGIKDPIELEEVELSSFVFEALEGGSVAITFRASCHPDAEEAGALYTMIQEDVEITLVPPRAKDDAQQKLAA